MNKKLIAGIIKTGAVIITTLTSFAVSPPVIDPSELEDGVNWKNVIIFVTGVLTILLYDRFKKRKKTFAAALYLVFSFVLLLAAYEFIYYRYSVTCSREEEKGETTYRCVISGSPVKKEVQQDLDGWLAAKSANPVQNLVKAYNCRPATVWPYASLALPYYAFILLYFLMAINFILLLIALSEKTFIPDDEEN